MTIQAQSIIRKAQIDLLDEAGTRWPARELVSHLNDAVRALVVARPDITTTTTAVALAAGARQALPAQAALLVDIPCNATGKKRAISKVDQLLLDRTVPGWQGMPQALEVEHFMHDLREPRAFLVYPPARVGAQVDLTWAARLQPVPEPLGATWAQVSGGIELSEDWDSALLNYVLYRAYSKDAEVAGNAQLAASHLALFNNAAGIQLEASSTVAPQT